MLSIGCHGKCWLLWLFGNHSAASYRLCSVVWLMHWRVPLVSIHVVSYFVVLLNLLIRLLRFLIDFLCWTFKLWSWTWGIICSEMLPHQKSSVNNRVIAWFIIYNITKHAHCLSGKSSHFVSASSRVYLSNDAQVVQLEPVFPQLFRHCTRAVLFTDV